MKRGEVRRKLGYSKFKIYSKIYYLKYVVAVLHARVAQLLPGFDSNAQTAISRILNQGGYCSIECSNHVLEIDVRHFPYGRLQLINSEDIIP
jgi:hypothetical protein